jgi:diacylglycerol kinase
MAWKENFFIICLTIITLATIASATFFYHSRSKMMANNVNTAIEKGIDPLSVRCSYANSDDIICITFTAQEAKTVLQSK